jgi:transcriptional regulator with XRE-family HTH domain
VTRGRRRRVDSIPEGQPAIVGANIRTLRQRKGWSQATLGELMSWQSASTVCAAEGRRDGRQRGFTAREIERLAAVFGVSARQLTTRCMNCNGQPPAGFACLAWGAAPGNDRLPDRLTSWAGAVRPRGTVRVTGRRATWQA